MFYFSNSALFTVSLLRLTQKTLLQKTTARDSSTHSVKSLLTTHLLCLYYETFIDAGFQYFYYQIFLCACSFGIRLVILCLTFEISS